MALRRCALRGLQLLEGSLALEHRAATVLGGKLLYNAVSTSASPQGLSVAAAQRSLSPSWYRSISTGIGAVMGPYTLVVPSLGAESITEGTIATVLRKPGDVVREDEVFVQIETDKVTVDVKYQQKEAGVIKSVMCKEGDVVKIGQPLADIEQGAVPEAAAAPAKPAAAAAAPAPAAKKAEAPKAAPAAAAPPPKPAPAAPAAAAPGGKPERRVKMSRLRLRVAERLKGAQNTYALLTTFNEVDMSGIMALRNKYKDVFLEKHGVKLGFMSAFVKAAASALKAVPEVNAVIEGDDIVYRDFVDISVAVGTPKGLVVPVLRGVEAMNFADVEKGIGALGRKARDGTLTVDDMAGGTFTISNGGVYGSMLSTPIVNPPQSAILGMHNIVQRAVVLPDGRIEGRPMMYVALTYDHRLIDGREAVTFLRHVKDVVEDPARLVLDV